MERMTSRASSEYCNRVLRSWALSDAQLRVLTTRPMDCRGDLARFFVDISDDVLDQRPREALPRPRADARRIPGGLQIFRQAI